MKRESKADSSETDQLSRFKRWSLNNRWIAVLLIVGTIVIALGKFTDAIEKIRHFFSPSVSPNQGVSASRPFREVRARALTALEALEKRGLGSQPGYITNFMGAAHNLRSSLRGDVLLNQFNEGQKSRIGSMSEAERKEAMVKQIELLNQWSPYKAMFTTEGAFRLNNYRQLSLEFLEMKDALEEIGKHPEFPASRRSLHATYVQTIGKMARTCELVVAGMSELDKRDLSQRLKELEENMVPPRSELTFQALRDYLSAL